MAIEAEGEGVRSQARAETGAKEGKTGASRRSKNSPVPGVAMRRKAGAAGVSTPLSWT